MIIRKTVITDYINGKLDGKSFTEIEDLYNIESTSRKGDRVRGWINWYNTLGKNIGQYAPGKPLNDLPGIGGKEFTIELNRDWIPMIEESIRKNEESDLKNLFLKSKWQVQTKNGIEWLESYHNNIDPKEIQKFRDSLISELPSFPKRELNLKVSPYGTLAVISIPDFHIGRERDSENNQIFLSTIETLLQKVSHHILDEIVFVIGNDYLNSDFDYKTTKGTQQFDYQTWKETWSNGRDLLVGAIELLKQKKCKVKVINIPGNHDCYSDDTQVLTYKGFKEHKDLLPDDLIATLNPKTLEVEYQNFTDYFAKEYNGKMISIKNRYSDTLVTPGHNLFLRSNYDDFYKLTTAKETFEDESHDKSFKTRGNNFKKDINISDNILRLCAWINTDGSVINQVNSTTYSIYQSKPNTVEILRKLFSDLNIYPTESVRNREISDIEGKSTKSNYPQYTFTLNTKNSGSDIISLLENHITDKYIIPDILKECSTRQFLVYLREYILGDGTSKQLSSNQDWHQIYGTEKILSDLQHLCVVNNIDCKFNKNIRGDYELYVNINPTNHILRATSMSEIDYTGNVWCLSVPNRNFFTRRSGIVNVHGNCTRMFQLGDVIQAYYREDNQVVVDNSDRLIKAFTYGDVLLAFEHGEFRREEYESILANEFPELWGTSKYREFLCGHLHAETVKEFRGLKLRHLPSLANESEWEKKQGYKHKKEAQLLLYSKSKLEAIYIV